MSYDYTVIIVDKEFDLTNLIGKTNYYVPKRICQCEAVYNSKIVSLWPLHFGTGIIDVPLCREKSNHLHL